MARTKQTARKSTGGKAPVEQVAPKADFKDIGASSPVPPAAPPLPPDSTVAKKIMKAAGVTRLVPKPAALDVMVAKSKLRRAKPNYQPIKCDRKRIFDHGRYQDLMEWNKDYFPLSHGLRCLQEDQLSGDLVEIDFSGIDQMTDVFFHWILKNTIKVNFLGVKILSVSGCVHLTDDGVAAIVEIFGHLATARFNGCRKVTEKGLYHLLKANSKTHDYTAVELQATNVGIIPAINSEAMTSLKLNACPLISPTMTEYFSVGKLYFDEGQPGNYLLNTHKLVILNHHMFKFSLGHFIATKEKKGLTDLLRVWQNVGPIASTTYNIIEMSNVETYMDLLINDGCAVVIPFYSHKLSDDGYKKLLVSSFVMAAINVSTDICVVLVDLTDDPDPTVTSAANEELMSHINSVVTSYRQGLLDNISVMTSGNWKVANTNFAQQQEWSIAESRLRGMKDFLSNKRFYLWRYDSLPFPELAQAISETVPWQEKFGPSVAHLVDELTESVTSSPLVKRLKTAYENPDVGQISSRQRAKGLEILSGRVR